MGVATASGQCVLAPTLGCFNHSWDLMTADNELRECYMCPASGPLALDAPLISEECPPLLSFTMNKRQWWHVSGGMKLCGQAPTTGVFYVY